VVVVSGVVVVAVMAVIGRSLFAVLVDEEAAAVGGLPVRALNDVLMVLTAVTVVVGMRTVGILLVSALMVLPVGASKALTTSFRSLRMVGSAFGAGRPHGESTSSSRANQCASTQQCVSGQPRSSKEERMKVSRGCGGRVVELHCAT
jgi:zinc transport system permease protein